jgi:hypothetical protein
MRLSNRRRLQPQPEPRLYSVEYVGGQMNTAEASSGSRYATSFKERLFGAKCEVEIVIDLSTHAPSSVLSMTSLLSSRPIFSISLENLKLLARGVADLKNNAKLLNALTVGATYHQLICIVGGATAIVFQPPGKAARFTLTIGAFHRMGLLEELDTRDIDVAIRRIDALQVGVVQRVATAAKA